MDEPAIVLPVISHIYMIYNLNLNKWNQRKQIYTIGTHHLSRGWGQKEKRKATKKCKSIMKYWPKKKSTVITGNKENMGLSCCCCCNRPQLFWRKLTCLHLSILASGTSLLEGKGMALYLSYLLYSSAINTFHAFL